MRVLHINCNYVGTELHRNMVRKLSALGIENTVFCPIYNQDEKKIFLAQPNEKIAVCFKKHDRLLYFIKQKKIITKVRALIDANEFDLIHAYTLMTDGNIARTLAKQYNKPYVVAVRDTDVNGFFRLKPYLRLRGIRIMRDASAVFFLSETYRTEVLQHFVPKQYREEISAKTHVIPNGINDFWLDNRFTTRDILKSQNSFEQRKLKVVCVGRINKRKNIPIVQLALSHCEKKAGPPAWR